MYTFKLNDGSLYIKRISNGTLFSFLFVLLNLTIYLIFQVKYWSQNFGNLEMFLLLFFILLPVFWIYFHAFGYKEFFASCCNLIFVLASVSLILWLLISILHLLDTNSVISINWGYKQNVGTFHNLYFETQGIDFSGRYITRNTGIWPEAPMYAMILSFGLIIECYITKKKRSFVLFVLCLTLLSTFSTSGFLVIFLLLILWEVSKLKEGSNNLLGYISLVLAFFLLVPAFAYLYFMIVDKVSSSSGSIRFDDYIVGIKSFFMSPIFGHGFNNTEFLKQFMNLGLRQGWVNGMMIFNTGIASGWVQVFSDGGVILALVYVFPILKSLFSFNKVISENKIFFLVFVMMFVLVMSYTELFIAFLALALIDIPNNDSRNESLDDVRGEL